MADDRTPDIDEEDDDSDLPPGPHLKPTKITPELAKQLDEAEERMKQRLGTNPHLIFCSGGSKEVSMVPLIGHLKNTVFQAKLARLFERIQSLPSSEGGGGPEAVVTETPVRKRKRQIQRRLTEQETDELVAAYRAGDPVKDLVARFKVDAKTIYLRLKRQGVPLRNRTHQ